MCKSQRRKIKEHPPKKLVQGVFNDFASFLKKNGGYGDALIFFNILENLLTSTAILASGELPPTICKEY